MSKKSIFIILFIMALSVGIISIYSTFAYDEEAALLDESTADYNLLYTIRKNSEHQIIVTPGETKFIDVTLSNNYESSVKYGIFYRLLSPNKMPDNVTITKADESPNLLEDVIKTREKKVITIKVVNSSEENLDLVIGAIVGFENGNIRELIKEGEILIK